MILGRPTNLWLGAITAVFNVVVLVLATFGYHLNEAIYVSTNLAFATIIGLIANQPPVVNPGDTIHVTTPTPKGEPAGENREVTIH